MMRNSVSSGRATRRGQSQLLGYMLLVGLGLSAFFAAGYLGIEQLSETSNQPQSIASADVESHAAALEELSTGTPYRSVEFSGADGNIRYGDPITVTVQASAPSGSLSPVSISATPLIYDVDDTQIASVLGATVLQGQSGGVVMQSVPPVQIAPQQSTLRLMETAQSGGADQLTTGENRAATVSNHRYQTQTTRFEPTDTNGDLEIATVTITIQSPRYEAWAAFYRDHPQVDSVSTTASNEVTIQFDTKRLLIQHTSINMKITR